MPLLLTEDEVKSMMSIADAIPIIEESFLLAGQGQAESPARYRMHLDIGHLQFGPAAMPSKNAIGFKMSAYLGKRVADKGFGRRWNFIFDSTTGELTAIIQAYAISRMRTAAASAVAAKYLSPPDAATVGMIGTGTQAAAQLEAICKVRPIRRAFVFSRDRDKREAYCAEASRQLGIEVIPVETARDVVAPADIIVTMTNATDPVLFGDWIDKPVLVLAGGANHWYKRELDRKVIETAQFLVVDDKETARVESGALLRSAAHGRVSWQNVHELGTLVAEPARVPDLGKGTIVFLFHGIALEDVAISVVAIERARARGLGSEINL